MLKRLHAHFLADTRVHFLEDARNVSLSQLNHRPILQAPQTNPQLCTFGKELIQEAEISVLRVLGKRWL